MIETQCHTAESANHLAVFTLVVWLLCAVLGALGFVLPYARPRPPAPPEAPVIAQQLQVELTKELFPPPETPPPVPDPLAPPPPPDAMTLPPVVQTIAVAQPSPAVAFALPVEGPTRVVEVKRAEYARPTVTNVPVVAVAPPAPAPSARLLTFGEGDGKQPAPEYPRAALRLGQEGTVLVRVEIGEDGGFSTRIESASPWPILNEAALKHVRDRYHFNPGPRRIYDVPIRYEITK